MTVQTLRAVSRFAAAALLGAAPLAMAQSEARVVTAPVAAAPSSLAVAARLTLVTGRVTVKGTGQSLVVNDPVYEGQTLDVGPNSYASLKFSDGGRVLLRPDTEFAVESFRYEGAPPPEDAKGDVVPAPAAKAVAGGTAFFRLVRGGFRAISGLIGKADRQSYRVTTPAATIGIRGTDYEVALCTNDCPTPSGQASAGGVEVASTDLAGLQLAEAGGSGGGEGGAVVATHEGGVTLRTSRGDFNVDAGQVALALNNGQTFMLPAIPDLMLQNPTDDPKACE